MKVKDCEECLTIGREGYKVIMQMTLMAVSFGIPMQEFLSLVFSALHHNDHDLKKAARWIEELPKENVCDACNGWGCNVHPDPEDRREASCEKCLGTGRLS